MYYCEPCKILSKSLPARLRHEATHKCKFNTAYCNVSVPDKVNIFVLTRRRKYLMLTNKEVDIGDIKSIVENLEQLPIIYEYAFNGLVVKANLIETCKRFPFNSNKFSIRKKGKL